MIVALCWAMTGMAENETGMAESHSLLWDFTLRSPDETNTVGLTYLGRSDDAEGVNNGLKGIKLDSKGYCYFTKPPVAGRLKLYFADRTTNKPTSLLLYTWQGDTPSAQTLLAETGELTEYGMQAVDLDETQNNIYITRGNQQVETVVQKIIFIAGRDTAPEPVTLLYRDQHGAELGRAETTAGAVLETIPYQPSDLPAMAPNERFRGWYYLSGRKVQPGDTIRANTTICAKVTPVAHATLGSVQTYDLASPVFYVEDHDLLTWTDETVTLRTAGAKTVVWALFRDGCEQTWRFADQPSVTIPVPHHQLAKIQVYNVPQFMDPDSAGTYHVPASDAASFLLALMEANKTGHAQIYLPNGIYDLGSLTLTPIRANGITIRGESMNGTVICNTPDYRIESIDRTATLLIGPDCSDTRLQDLTIRNAMDYYRRSSGRAVCLWDRGTRTLCRRVRMLSYQDTYYSDHPGAIKWFEDCEIHGTTDYICGDGSVYFHQCVLYCEKRNLQNTGLDIITACSSTAQDQGFVFINCTIRSECPVVSLGRAWRHTPKVVFINTLMDYTAGSFRLEDGVKTQRWTAELMNPGAWPAFGEYRSHTADGTLLTPATNDILFIDTKSGHATRLLPTVLSSRQAARFLRQYRSSRKKWKN